MVARSFISLLLALALLGSVSSAKVLAQSQTTQPAPSIEGLIESMVNYHPYVLAINEGNYQAAAELEIARSSFDPFIEQKTKSRVSGYYDSVSTASQVVISLATKDITIRYLAEKQVLALPCHCYKTAK